jgi:beta-lactamase class A
MSGQRIRRVTALLMVVLFMSSCTRMSGGTFVTDLIQTTPLLDLEEGRSDLYDGSTGVRSPKRWEPTINTGPDLIVLNELIAAFVAEHQGRFGVYVIDLVSGQSTGVNSDQPFVAASTFKLPVAMYVLDQVGRGQVDLEDTVEYEEGDWEEGAGTLHLSLPGDSFTVAYLTELMMLHSDNIALKMLLRHLNKENVYAYMRHLGGTVLFYDEQTWGTTPQEMGDYLYAAYTGQGLHDPAQGVWLLEALSMTAFTDRIAAGVPSEVRVAHKIGTLPGVVNDVAVVYALPRPFLLSVFSEGVDMEQAPQVIADLTRLVYRFLNGL